jgi:hypothetical protein
MRETGRKIALALAVSMPAVFGFSGCKEMPNIAKYQREASQKDLRQARAFIEECVQEELQFIEKNRINKIIKVTPDNSTESFSIKITCNYPDSKSSDVFEKAFRLENFRDNKGTVDWGRFFWQVQAHFQTSVCLEPNKPES